MAAFFEKIFSINFKKEFENLDANDVLAAVAEYLEKFFAELFAKLA